MAEEAMAPHSSTLAWRMPWTEEPGGLQFMGSLRVRHDWATEQLHFSLPCIGKWNGNPLQCSCLENPRDGGAWWAAICGVTQSRTQLKRLSSSSSRPIYRLGFPSSSVAKIVIRLAWYICEGLRGLCIITKKLGLWIWPCPWILLICEIKTYNWIFFSCDCHDQYWIFTVGWKVDE